MVLVGATFLHTTILDVDGDVAAGKRTTTVAFGVVRSAWLATALAAAAVVYHAWARFKHDGPLVPLVVTTALLVVFAAANAAIARAEKLDPVLRSAARSRASALVVQGVSAGIALWAGARDPMLLVLLVPLVVAARFYYRARFSIRYPG
jgi:4-hydroxybenzoate polyprenyltransferase